LRELTELMAKAAANCPDAGREYRWLAFTKLSTSGRSGEICAVGFASRKNEIALYGLDIATGQTLFPDGKYKTEKGCCI
jgi:hypothetical protein